jgi:hypothetical protein
MRTYVLLISKGFPDGHPKAGKLTGFKTKIKNGIKIHTIRANYELWKNRIEDVAGGAAVLSLRQWEGLPYRSPQKEFMRLTADSGIGIQKLYCRGRWEINGKGVPKEELAVNDGLDTNDFTAWFMDVPVFTPLALIHFTGFRYEESRPPLLRKQGERREKTATTVPETVRNYAARITAIFQDHLVYDVTDREWIQLQNKLEELIVEMRNFYSGLS